MYIQKLLLNLPAAETVRQNAHVVNSILEENMDTRSKMQNLGLESHDFYNLIYYNIFCGFR